MVLTFSPIVNIFRLSQPQNALPPIVVTKFGISTLVKPLHIAYLLLVDYQHSTL